jgi:hypothetical protein
MDETQATAVNDADSNTMTEVFDLLQDYKSQGPHPEYKAFEMSLGSARRRVFSVWQFIEDAVKGTGGFADGRYLFPTQHEIDQVTGFAQQKLQDRREQADYDQFAAKVCNLSWDMITSTKDLIRRETSDTRLQDFWSDADRQGTHVADFWEHPFRQARMYGTGFVFVDRPNVELRSQADDTDPANRVYAYSVPTRNVVHWEFDDFGLSGLVVLEPEVEDTITPLPLDDHEQQPCNVRVWTRDYWARFAPVSNDGKTDYTLTDSGINAIGEIPVVVIFNDTPDPGRLFGHSEMLGVSRLAQSVYEIDSERREQERRCNNQLTMPVKDASAYESKQVLMGLDTVMLYDGEAGAPAYLSPDLAILEKLKESRDDKVTQAFDMACLNAFVAKKKSGLEATSGIHAGIELYKTETRIAGHAASLEKAEQRIATLVLKYYGVKAPSNDLFTVVYPRKFGIQDVNSVLEQTATVIELGLGDGFNQKSLYTLAKAMFPREPDDEINKIVNEAVATLKSQAEKAAQVSATQTSETRVQALLGKTVGAELKPESAAG